MVARPARFTHEELKRQFPSTYREMLSDHQARKRLGEQGQQEVEQRAHVQAGPEGAAEGARAQLPAGAPLVFAAPSLASFMSVGAKPVAAEQGERSQ